jgi:primosomal protein N' (replication factor Y)
LQCTQKHDFKQFFYHESADRRSLGYPPFGRLALLQMRHKNEKKVWHAALHLASLLNAMDKSYEVLGPSPAPLAKLQQYFRFQIILKSHRKIDPPSSRMRAAIKKAVEVFRKESRHSATNLTIDIDPMSIL